jgi:E3 ubiquitin-protein ligase DOA10
VDLEKEVKRKMDEKLGKNCRICLEEGNDCVGMVRPCRCSGSLEGVHEECLRKWIETILERRYEKGENCEVVSCEICKEVFEFTYRRKLVCKRKGQREEAIQ